MQSTSTAQSTMQFPHYCSVYPVTSTCMSVLQLLVINTNNWYMASIKPLMYVNCLTPKQLSVIFITHGIIFYNFDLLMHWGRISIYRPHTCMAKNWKDFKLLSSTCKAINKTTKLRKQNFILIWPDFLKKSAKLVCLMVVCEHVKDVKEILNNTSLPHIICKIKHSVLSFDVNIAFSFAPSYISHLSLMGYVFSIQH